MKTFRTYTESTIKCDRCGEDIPENTGTEDEDNLTGYFLVPKKNVILETNACSEPDLCQKCVESLNNWFSSVEKNYTLPPFQVISDMADHIAFLHKEYNELELEGGGYVEEDREQIIKRYMDAATEEIRRTEELRRHQK